MSDAVTRTSEKMISNIRATVASTASAPAAEYGNLGAVFDFFVPNLNALIVKEGYDPLKSAESPKVSFSQWFIMGGAEAEAPTIYGLSHLKRTGLVNIDGLTVTINIGVDGEVSGGMGAKAWLGPVILGPDISFTISNIDIRVVMTLEKDQAGKGL